jgi:hypothetical protein
MGPNNFRIIILLFILLCASACGQSQVLPPQDTPDIISPELKTPTNLPAKSLSTQEPTGTLSPTSITVKATPSPTFSQESSGAGSGAMLGSVISEDTWSVRDVPPADVIEQISYIAPGGAGGGGPCASFLPGIDTQPILEIGYGSNKDNRLAINQLGFLCGPGIEKNQKVTITITGPNNFEEIKTFNGPTPSIRLDLLPKSGDILGTYNISIEGNQINTDLTYDVVEATRPVIAMIDSTGRSISINQDNAGWENFPSLKPGEELTMYFAGFRPESTVTLHFFKGNSEDITFQGDECSWHMLGCTKFNYEYATTRIFQSDERGELISTIATSPTAQETSVMVLVSGENAPNCKASGPWFSIFGDLGQTTCHIPVVVNIGQQPLPTATPDTANWSCTNTLPPRLQVEMRAMVSLDPPLPNTVRRMPRIDGEKIGKIPAGQEVNVLAGPICADGYFWWNVYDRENTMGGWTAEGDDENYWLEPLP